LHKNLAARNVLVVKDEKTVKLTDMGLAKEKFDAMTVNTPQTRWLAPETIQSEKFTTQSDVWQFGILVWELFNGGKLPYGETYGAGANLTALAKEIANNGATPKLSSSMPSWASDLAKSCWSKDPSARPTFASLAATLDEIQIQLSAGAKRSTSGTWKTAKRGTVVTNV